MSKRKPASILGNPDQIKEISKAVTKKMVDRPTTESPKEQAKEKREAGIIIRVGKSFHRLAKIAAAKQEITMREYLENLIEADQAGKEA